VTDVGEDPGGVDRPDPYRSISRDPVASTAALSSFFDSTI